MVASQCNSQEWDDAPDEVPWLDNEVERQFEIQDERHIHEVSANWLSRILC